MSNKLKKNRYYKILLVKEIIFTILALLSIGLLIYEFIAMPSEQTVKKIMRFDFIVALIFLSDFMAHLYLTKDKKYYFKHNWLYLLASIPIVDGWAEVLRGLRILGLIRLLRAGEHLKKSLEYR